MIGVSSKILFIFLFFYSNISNAGRADANFNQCIIDESARCLQIKKIDLKPHYGNKLPFAKKTEVRKLCRDRGISVCSMQVKRECLKEKKRHRLRCPRSRFSGDLSIKV